MSRLQPGDIVRHKSGGGGYIVTANYGARITAVRTADISNPDEWDVVKAHGEVPEFLRQAFNEGDGVYRP
jgi:hypothetical protein